MTERPLIAVTMGDPAGIGPEITVKAFAEPDFHLVNRAVVVGDPERLALAARQVGVSIEVRPVEKAADARALAGTVHVLPHGSVPGELPFGQTDARAGEAAVQYVQHSARLAMAGEVDGVATAPLNKEAMHLAGYTFPGHIEILADVTGTPHHAMMLVAGKLRVIHVSTHVSMQQAIERVQRERVLRIIRLAHQTLTRMGLPSPRIAVAGINPHAGENGLFGREEIEQITPAVQDAISEGINASGPWPGDTVFMRALRGEFDVVVAQYHDQGHIPIKLLGVDTGVSVTIGLPFVRTSVDHGTAFDIAGKGIASPDSLRAAIDLATQLALEERRHRHTTGEAPS